MKKLLMAVLALISIVTASFAVACGGGLELSAPTNVKYDGSVITWDKVDGADLYKLTIGEREYAVTTNRYSYNANGKEFTVSIKASSKAEKVDSQESAIQTFIPLSKNSSGTPILSPFTPFFIPTVLFCSVRMINGTQHTDDFTLG